MAADNKPESKDDLTKLDIFALRIEVFVGLVGRVIAWSSVLLVINIIVQVFLRYGLKKDSIAIGELEWHFYAVMVMMSLSYAQVKDAHVRVDILHRLFPPRVKQVIEIVGIGIFLIPLAAIIFWYGCDFTSDAWRIGEKSPSPGGMPWRWAIKAFIPIGAAMLMLSSIARLLRLITGSLQVPDEGHIAD